MPLPKSFNEFMFNYATLYRILSKLWMTLRGTPLYNILPFPLPTQNPLTTSLHRHMIRGYPITLFYSSSSVSDNPLLSSASIPLTMVHCRILHSWSLRWSPHSSVPFLPHHSNNWLPSIPRCQTVLPLPRHRYWLPGREIPRHTVLFAG